MKFQWSIAPPQAVAAGNLAKALGISPLLAQCLLNRGISTSGCCSDFLEPRLKQLADPFLLPGMSDAIERLLLARDKGEAVVVFGDYDVDGVTSTALLLEVLGKLGWKVNWYLPSRLDEGYGLSLEAAKNCLAKHPCSLLLAVDCASTANSSIDELRALGVDVIVVDHHQVSEPPPKAFALVNPQLLKAPVTITTGASSTTMPPVRFQEMCSVGLAFKLAHALVKRGRERGLPGTADYDLRPLLDLVALGTIADIVPLIGENRILVRAGLERLNQTTRTGLVALKRVANSPAELGTFEVGFQLAPRLNASGRLETAEESLMLLMAQNPAEAMKLAISLDKTNRERQQIEKGIAEALVKKLQETFSPERDYVIVEGNASWHIGVVGIVASRVLQQFYRPTIILGGDGQDFRGSGRSVAGFDLATALRDCSDLLLKHGGHAMAAGVSLKPERLDEFRSRLNEISRARLTEQMLQPNLRLDAEVGLEEISLECLGLLDRLRPVGQGNPAVQFCARGVTHRRPLERMGIDKKHVKMWVTNGMGTHEAVWWGAGQEPLPVGTFDLAFAPAVNHYLGTKRVQLKVLDWRPTTSPTLL